MTMQSAILLFMIFIVERFGILVLSASVLLRGCVSLA